MKTYLTWPTLLTRIAGAMPSWSRGIALSLWMALGLAGFAGHAQAGWNAYVNGDTGFNSPTAYANLRTIDFSTGSASTATTYNTLTTEQTAARLSFATSLASGASFSQTDTGAGDGMSGKHVQIASGTTTNTSTLTVTFGSGSNLGTSYVAFLWYIGLKDQDGASVTYNFSDGTSQTLTSCNTAVTSTCVAAYVPTNFLTNLFNALTLCLFGCNQYDTVYLTYVPSTGVKITSVVFSLKRCDGCGFLGANASQDMYVENLSYVDPTVAPHHLELTTPSATINAGTNATFTVKSCMDAACTTLYTTGMSGTLALTGTSMTPTYPSGQTYAIGARSSTGTLAASISPAGTATVALSLPSIAPSTSPAVYCGIGVAAANGNSCDLTVIGLHHLEVTSSTSSATTGTAVTYTIKACANAGCSTLWTGGVTGSLSITGLGLIMTGGGAFTITAGTSSTTLAATVTGIGTATVAVTGTAPTPTAAAYCGLGAAASNGVGACSFSSTLTMHHLEITAASSTAVTCQPTTYTIKACANAACSSLYTAGVTGTLTVSGPTTVTYPGGQSFSIANGSSSTTISAWAKSTGTATAALSSVLPVGTDLFNPTWCGMGVAAASGGSCGITVSNSALIFDVPNHKSDVSQTVSVTAVKSSADQTACTPAYTGAQNITFKCTYTNPATGTKPVQVGGASLNATNNAASACDGTGRAVSLTFDAGGVASTSFRYADVGQVGLTATGSDPGMTGSDSFIAVPAALAITSVTAAPIRASSTFSATISGRNSSNQVTPNFGREVTTNDYVRLAWTKYKPVGVNAAEVFTGAGISGASPYICSQGCAAPSVNFSSGAATVSNLSWTEVGVGDLTATLVGNSYLGVSAASMGLAAYTGTTGTTGAVGPITPDHFTVTIDSATQQGCGTFTYSGLAPAVGQTFTPTVTAWNGAATPVKTLNYGAVNSITGSYPSGVTLSIASLTPALAPITSTLSSATVTGFTAGVGTGSPNIAFSTRPIRPTVAVMRATDSTYNTVSSSGFAEGSTTLRSGRIRLANAFGSGKTALQMPVQVQYWSGSTWVINGPVGGVGGDSCTSIPATAVARSNYLNHKGVATATWTTTPSAITISGGNGTLTLSVPSPASAVGSVDIALNLGSAGLDSSCLATHPGTTGANLPWLRGQNGASNGCGTSVDRDPSARATFGVFSPESRRTVFTRELF